MVQMVIEYFMGTFRINSVTIKEWHCKLLQNPVYDYLHNAYSIHPIQYWECWWLFDDDVNICTGKLYTEVWFNGCTLLVFTFPFGVFSAVNTYYYYIHIFFSCAIKYEGNRIFCNLIASIELIAPIIIEEPECIETLQVHGQFHEKTHSITILNKLNVWKPTSNVFRSYSATNSH